MNFSVINSLLLFMGSFCFGTKRILRYLRYYQQEEYHSSRFLQWVWKYSAFDRKATLISILAILLMATGFPILMINTLFAISLILVACFEENPLKGGKLRLQMTKRAKEITFVTLFIYLLCLQLCIWPFQNLPVIQWLLQILCFQCIPLYLVVAKELLQPKEKFHQKQLRNEAIDKWKEVSPFVIGITGSYGKSSTKDILAHLLQVTLGPTFWPKKGINTEMGITREIRTHLKKGIKYAVIEMAAYGPGSIKKLCTLTPPHAAIITGIGSAHLERFGSEETIKKSKAELAQALPSTGILVCNGDNVGARWIAQENPKKLVLLYGFEKEKGPLDCWISEEKTFPNGMTFTLTWKGRNYEAFTPLFGNHSLLNIAAAFTLACTLGADPLYLIAAIRNLEPIDNRLQVKKRGKITFIHDAYNSNPIGFSAALNLLSSLPGKRRIVMTPGMIELGPQQESENCRIGKMTATVCQLALIVGKTNRDALMQGLISGGMAKEHILLCHSRTHAFETIEKQLQDDDIVLIENDLPDIYETKMSV